MSFWKVLGGAAAGVACIVALPVAGPIGAVTAAGAAIAGTLGATAGGIAEAMDDSEEEAEKRGEERAAAEYDKKYEKLLVAFEDAKSRIKDTEGYFNLIIAMEAVGLACANCDGEISENERLEIDTFIAGSVAGNLPENIKKKIQSIADNPPNITTAFHYASKVGLNSTELFEDIIEIVMEADGYRASEEEKFKSQWNQLVEMAS
ncbi:hypothetical protein [Pelagibaculum spongiae]|uniref:Co-chaperone DjlA N-terminal domain-containing protein n=1 Tax=Pelagibaculum spongiae TaxID=2080658 RepID=A0A2V1H432_9GAMM|nr:hypothetical protein [Pelagibaculum spongiae]PVZ70396.1 hypothetical protein DC094_07325 [Pelagibaculum spongiae]